MDKILDTKRNRYTRNYGIDLFRIVAMFMIVTHHVLKHGGARTSFRDPIYSYVAH